MLWVWSKVVARLTAQGGQGLRHIAGVLTKHTGGGNPRRAHGVGGVLMHTEVASLPGMWGVELNPGEAWPSTGRWVASDPQNPFC